MAAPSAAQQALALYRRGLALSRQLADPCMRHYAFGRITHAFRRVPPRTACRALVAAHAAARAASRVWHADTLPERPAGASSTRRL